MGRPAIDHTGERHGMLTVVKRVYSPAKSGSDGNARWLCRCDCGGTTILRSSDLRKIKSCGCLLRTMHETHGKSDTRLYAVWNSIKQRCGNPHVKTFCWYGGAGVDICDEWKNSFEAFEAWALANGYDSESPRGVCTIDRIDPDGGYNPDNCRVVDMKIQANNTHKNLRIKWNGTEKTLAEWSRVLGINYGTLHWRYENGQRGDRLLRPTEKRGQRREKCS